MTGIATQAGKVRIVFIESIFTAKRSFRTVSIDSAIQVADLARREFGEGHYHFIIHGKKVDPADWVFAGDEVIIAKKPDDIFSFIIFVIINAIIGIGVSLAVNALIGPRGTSSSTGSGKDGSATYAFDGLANTFTQGRPIPRVYGTHRVGGQIIHLHRRNASATDHDMYLYLALGLCSGPIEGIGSNLTADASNLVTKGRFVEDFEQAAVGDDLDVLDDWTLHAGTAGTAEVVTGKYLRALSVAGTGCYRAKEEVRTFRRNVHIEAEYRARSAGGGDARELRLCVNMVDESNYHFLAFANGANILKWGKRIAGVDTIEGTGTAAVGDKVAMERREDIVTIRNETTSTVLDTFAADAGVENNDVGVATFAATGTVDIDNIVIKGVDNHPEGIKLNGVEANSLVDIRGWYRFGRQYQESIGAIQDFKRIVQVYKPKVTISQSWVEYVFHSTVEGFDLVFELPRGLIDQRGGTPSNMTITLAIEYRPNDASSWTSLGTYVITKKLTSAFTMTFTHEPGTPLSGTKQQVRVRRVGGREADDILVADDIIWADVNELASIEDDRERVYPGTAIVALRIRASEQISGGTPEVTTNVKGVRVPTWTGNGSSIDPPLKMLWSNNPAWVVADILLNREHGLGNWIRPEHIDWPAFLDWAEWCDDVVTYWEEDEDPLFTTTNTESITAGSKKVVVDNASDAAQFAVNNFCRIDVEGVNKITAKVDLGGGRTEFTLAQAAVISRPATWAFHKVQIGGQISEARHSFDGVFDASQESAWDAILRACRCGRAVPFMIGSKISVRYEGTGNPVAHINESNILKDTFEISYLGSSEQVDVIQVEFLNAANDYDFDIAKASALNPNDVDHEPVIKVMSLFGITRKTHARREANYWLRASRLVRKRSKWTQALDGFAAVPGDIVTIGSWLAQWSHWTGRAYGTKKLLKLSHDVTFAAGVTYFALIRLNDDHDGVQVTITAAAGTYTAGTEIATNAADDVTLNGDVCTIGEGSDWTTKWRITKTTLNPTDLTIAIEAVEYVPEIYDIIGWHTNPSGSGSGGSGSGSGSGGSGSGSPSPSGGASI